MTTKLEIKPFVQFQICRLLSRSVNKNDKSMNHRKESHTMSQFSCSVNDFCISDILIHYYFQRKTPLIYWLMQMTHNIISKTNPLIHSFKLLSNRINKKDNYRAKLGIAHGFLYILQFTDFINYRHV